MPLSKAKLREYSGANEMREKIIGVNDGYRSLMIAVVNQAITDYRGHDYRSSPAMKSHAREWLLRHGAYWLEAVGFQINQDWWDCWVKGGCKRNGKRG
jgi:hypothetical protein